MEKQLERQSKMEIGTCPFCQGDVIVFWKGIYCPACQVEWADEEDMNAGRPGWVEGTDYEFASDSVYMRQGES